MEGKFLQWITFLPLGCLVFDNHHEQIFFEFLELIAKFLSWQADRVGSYCHRSGNGLYRIQGCNTTQKIGLRKGEKDENLDRDFTLHGELLAGDDNQFLRRVTV